MDTGLIFAGIGLIALLLLAGILFIKHSGSR
jgi:hypothetical protein